MEAVQKGRQDDILTMLRYGDKVDAIYTLGRTILHCASANSNLEAVSTILLYSPSLTICDANGYTALHMACSRVGKESVEIIKKLLQAGSEVNCINKFSRTALHECVISKNVDGARALLESGASIHLRDSDGKTALELAVGRGCLEMAHMLTSKGMSKDDTTISSNHENQRENLNLCPMGATAMPALTVEQEKEVLKRRLAELEQSETLTLEASLKEKQRILERTKADYMKQREMARSEIFRLVQKIKTLQSEEEKKTMELEKEIDKLNTEIEKKKNGDKPDKNKDIVTCLECPVCLDVCKPPLQIWQCPEGHIICGSCVNRPELRVCPQCRISLTGQLSRNRALEDIARKTFPKKASKETKKSRIGTGSCPSHNSRSNHHHRSRTIGGSRRIAQIQNQVDQLINFSHFGMDYLPSDVDDDSYDLTSELDAFMPNFPSSISPPASPSFLVRFF